MPMSRKSEKEKERERERERKREREGGREKCTKVIRKLGIFLSILDEAFCVSVNINALQKGMNLSVVYHSQLWVNSIAA